MIQIRMLQVRKAQKAEKTQISEVLEVQKWDIICSIKMIKNGTGMYSSTAVPNSWVLRQPRSCFSYWSKVMYCMVPLRILRSSLWRMRPPVEVVAQQVSFNVGSSYSFVEAPEISFRIEMSHLRRTQAFFIRSGKYFFLLYPPFPSLVATASISSITSPSCGCRCCESAFHFAVGSIEAFNHGTESHLVYENLLVNQTHRSAFPRTQWPTSSDTCL